MPGCVLWLSVVFVYVWRRGTVNDARVKSKGEDGMTWMHCWGYDACTGGKSANDTESCWQPVER